MGGNADLMGKLEWVSVYGKKQCRSVYWRMKSAWKKAMKKRRSKQEFKFQYDPSSYALNFDDGCCNSDQDNRNIMWVYVLWVKS